MSRSAAAVLAGNGWMQPISPTFSADMCWRQPFTASQWRELEHQALIFKYLLAGVPVPPDLLIPIQKSFESLPSGFFHHIPSNSSPLGIFSYYGKKLDPEPGRCRRTDGKKWRCSKDAHTDSKYCERHMHRSRNRSRKHVESNNNPSQLDSESQITFPSTRTSHVSPSNIGSFQNNTMPFAVPCASKPQGLCSGSSGSSSLQFGSQDYEISSKGYLHESTKIDVDMHNLFSRYPSSIQTGLKTSQAPSFPISKEKTDHLYGNYSSQLQSIQDLNEGTIRSTVNKQDQHYPYFKSDFGLPVLMKQNCQCLRPAFNEWPKVKELWPGLDEEHSKKSSFSVTQLSMSIPMTSSDFSTTTCCSPNDD